MVTARLARCATALAAGLALLALPAGTASAVGFDPPPPSAPPPPGPSSWKPPTSTPGPATDGPTRTGVVRSCHIVSSSSYLGASCGSLGGDGTAPSIKSILGGSPLPTCWNEPMTVGELESMNVQNTPGEQGSTWYWYKCLTGIDPKTFAVAPGGVQFTIGISSYRNQPGPTDPKVVLLDGRQRQLIAVTSTDNVIPTPVAGVSPSAYPRVNQDVAFFEGQSADVVVRAVGVLLRARVERITVQPLGEGTAGLDCTGRGGTAQKGDTPASRPGLCWYRYKQSSAGQPDSMFQVPVTAHWQVSTSTDDGATWTPFNAFDKSSTTTVRVNEIQAIVVH